MARQEAAAFSTLEFNQLISSALRRQVFSRIPSNGVFSRVPSIGVWWRVVDTWDVILRVIARMSVSSIWGNALDLNVFDFQHQFSKYNQAGVASDTATVW